MPSIRIVSTPAGEAPQWVRDAWVGLVLPMHDVQEEFPLIGVQGGKPAPENQGGYTVGVEQALDALRTAGKTEAAAWWEENSLLPMLGALVFGKLFCEVIPD